MVGTLVYTGLPGSADPDLAVSRPWPYRSAPACVAVVLLGFFLGGTDEAAAHTRTRTISRIDLTPDAAGSATLRWQLRVRLFDLLGPLGHPENGDPQLVLADGPAAGRYLLDALTVTGDGRRCAGALEGVRQATEGDEATGVYTLAFRCADAARALDLRYDLFFALDLLHNGFATLEVDGRPIASHVFRSRARNVAVSRPGLGYDPSGDSVARQAVQYLWLGVEHIFLGYDHLAFLAALLLGATLVQRGRSGGEAQAPRAVATREAVVAVLKIVTAFTVAHSLTLVVAALRPALAPTGWVEPVIALSVAYVGIENLRPRVPNRRLGIVFAFGLVHGFGFASVLQEIGLPRVGLVASLLAFNLGVELGQAAAVTVSLPILLWLARRNTPAFERWVLGLGSTALAVAGLVWFVARVIG